MSIPSNPLQTAQRPRETAHLAGLSTGRWARWVLAVVACSWLLASANAQEIGKTPPPLPRAPVEMPDNKASAPILRAASSALTDKDPAVRAEAALTIGFAAVQADTEALRALCTDSDHTVRCAALFALGFHASPGTEAVLTKALEVHGRETPERMAAIFALSMLPDDRGGQALHLWLSRLRGGNWSRHRETVQAFAAALIQQPQPMRMQHVRDLIVELGRDPVLAGPLLKALAMVDGALTDEELLPWFESEHAATRLGAIEILLKRKPAAHAALLERLATRDSDPAVRARALRALTSIRAPAALEIGTRAIKTVALEESMAGMHAVLTLGGGRLRQSLEADLLKTPSKDLLLARLRQLPTAESESLRDACVELANAPRNSLSLRGAAAALARRSGDHRADALFPLLWEDGTAALEVMAPLPDSSTLVPDWLVDPIPAGTPSLPTHQRAAGTTARASAWLAIAPGAATLALAELLDKAELPSEARVALLRSYRIKILQPMRIPEPDVLPLHLREMLR